MSTIDEKKFYEDLGQKLLILRSEAGKKKIEVAKEIGMSSSMLSVVENKGEKISAFRLVQILDVLGYEVQFLKKNAPISLSK